MAGQDYRWRGLLGVIVFLLGLIWFLWPRPKMVIEDVAASFCREAGARAFLEMERSVDRRWISIKHIPPKVVWGRNHVVDRRTSYKISMHDLVGLANDCMVDATPQQDGVFVERLCDVYFVVSPDWKIRAIMDEATWHQRGEAIMKEILSDIASGTPVPSPVPRKPKRYPKWLEEIVQEAKTQLQKVGG